MANTIKLKTGSGSDPSASDLIVGEIAIRTDSGKLFTKKDNGTVAEISGSGGGLEDGDKGDITVSNGGDTFTIDSGVINNAKVASNAAIAGTKISPNFGSQQVETTGAIVARAGLTALNATEPQIVIQDSDTGNTGNAAETSIQFRDGGSNFQGQIGFHDVNTSHLFIDTASTSQDILLRVGGSGTQLRVDNAGIDVVGDITGTGNLTLTSTDTGSSAAPEFELYRNSASPADADYLGQLKFTGESDDGSKEVYAKVTGKIDDASSGTEDGLIEFALRKAGSNNIGARLTSTDLKLINGTGLEVAGDTTLSGTLDVGNFTRSTNGYGVGSTTVISAQRQLQNVTLSSSSVTATTQSAGNNTTRVATTAFVTTAISNLINGAPGSLDTLNELAAAMNDDAAFSTTVTNSLATKMPLAGGEFTGNITFSGSQTVDGRDLSVDGSKLDGIESGATADQTASEILTLLKTVDGAGSGLDADTIDGLGSGQFVRSDATDIVSGATKFTNIGLQLSGHWFNAYYDAANRQNYIHLYPATTSDRGTSASTTDIRAWTGSTFKVLQIKGDSNDITWGGSKLWTAANDGSGSGLDSDLLDGQEGSYYRNASNLNSGTISDARLPNSISSSITGNSATATKLATARTIAGVSFDGSANISLNNNAITNGAGYITASNAAITNKLPLAGGTLTGDLTINESHPSIFFVDSGDNPDYEVGNHDGAFVIQDDTNGVNRLVVNSDGHIDIAGNLDVGSGIDVTGASTFEATTFTGNVTLTSVTPQLYFTDTNHNPDYAIWNHNGVLRFLDTTNSNATRLEIQAGGLVKASNSFQVTGNITVSGTVDGRDLATDGTKLDGIESGATADQTNSEIKTAYEANSNTNAFTDALLSKLNGIAASATNVTNNNQLTNGAGYITATLTNEQVQDIVGGMVSGNTESGITVTYQDGDGTLDFSVASQTDQNFTTTLKNKLDGIASGATNVTNNNQISNGAGYVTSSVINSLNASNLSSGTIPDARFPSTLPAVDGSNLTGISAGATGGGSDEVFYENDQTVTTNYTITNGKNAMAAGPITINSGVTVTVGSGETLTIV